MHIRRILTVVRAVAVISGCVAALLTSPAVAGAAYYPGSTVNFGQQVVGTESAEIVVAQIHFFPDSITSISVAVTGTGFRRGPSSTCGVGYLSVAHPDCFVTVVFAPTSTGETTGMVRAQLKGCPAGCAAQVWVLKGTGVAAPPPGPGQPPSPLQLAPYNIASYSFSASYGPLGVPLAKNELQRSQVGTSTLEGAFSGTFLDDSYEFSSFSTASGISRGSGLPAPLRLSAGAAAGIRYDVRSGVFKRVLARADSDTLSFFQFNCPGICAGQGIALLTFRVDGSVVSVPGATVEAGLFVDSGPAAPIDGNNLLGPWSIQLVSGNDCSKCQIWEFPGNTSTTITASIPILWGKWTALSAAFVAVASALPSGSGVLQSDFAHTLTLVAAEATDEFGAVIPDATVEVASSDAVQAFIDVAPNESTNVINPSAKGKVQVAVFSSETFDATTLAIETARFSGAPVARNPKGQYLARPIDLDGDGLLDEVLEFEIQQLHLTSSDELGYFHGHSNDGTLVHGADVITVLSK